MEGRTAALFGGGERTNPPEAGSRIVLARDAEQILVELWPKKIIASHLRDHGVYFCLRIHIIQPVEGGYVPY
jgi:hypothetical protein